MSTHGSDELDDYQPYEPPKKKETPKKQDTPCEKVERLLKSLEEERNELLRHTQKRDESIRKMEQSKTRLEEIKRQLSEANENVAVLCRQALEEK